MFIYSSFEILLIKRFLFSKKTDGFISIFSWFSVIGISIGVAAIIIVMAVMNGFREELTTRMLGINGHLNIFSLDKKITTNDFHYINSDDPNLKVIPFTETQALIIGNDNSKGVILRGYDKKYLYDQHFLKNNIVEGVIFSNNVNDIVIGYALASQLGLNINDKIKIAIPKSDKTIIGNIPRFKTLNIVGIFNLGMYEYDSNFVFTNIYIANKLILLKQNQFNQIEIFTNNPNNIELIQAQFNQIIENNNLKLFSTSWKKNNAALINALNVEKNVMFLILTLIIIVASMNIISGMVIFVKEKNKDIGILKTIGLKNYSLIKIFLSIGLIIGLTGTITGGLVGVLFSLNIKKIQFVLENMFNINLFSEEVYYLSSLPSEIKSLEVFYVLLISVVICLIATSIPAYRSIKVDPIKSLKNE